MRNLKRALSLGLTAAMISGLMVMGSSAASYADVTSEDHQEAIDVLKAVGIMVGDEDGNFNPDQNVTRNEMAVIMSNLMDYTVASYRGTSPFTDVPDWAEPYVAACYTNGITAGTSATTFGGNESVTTGQAALMLLKALGYFQYQADFGSDWLVETTKQGSVAGLFDGVDTAATAALTRNDVAQMVLNALEADLVNADKNGSDVQIGDITISGGKATYTARTSSDSKYNKIDATRVDGKFTMQLGEDLYDGDLKKTTDTQDDFGRPANKWEYKNSSIGTYADEADAVYTAAVEKQDLYDLVGKTVYDDLRNENATLTVVVNGVDVKDPAVSDYIARNNSNKIGPKDTTGKGTTTEVFMDDDNNVTITVIDTYVAQVDGDYDDDDEELTLKSLDESAAVPADDMTLSADDFDNLDSYADDDYVLVTVADGEIKTIAPAEVVTGDVSAYTDTKSVTVDGTKYEYSKNYKDATVAEKVTYNLGSEYTVVLDNNGYVLYTDGTAGHEDYVYVDSMEKSGGVKSNLEGDAYFIDGTNEVIVIDNDDDFMTGDKVDEDVQGWYAYDEKNNGKYELSDIDDETNFVGSVKSGTVVENGKTNVNTGNSSHPTVKANSNTIFVVNDDDAITVYTGIKNVPDIKYNDKDITVAVVMDGKTYADVVYIYSANMTISGDSGDRVYILDSSSNASVDSDDNKYYEYDAIVNGEITTIKATTKELDEGLYQDVSYDENGYMDGQKMVSGEGDDNFKEYTGVTAIDYSGGVLDFGKKNDVTLADDYQIFVNDDGDGKTTTPSSLERDFNKDEYSSTVYVYLNDDEEAVEVYVWKDADADNADEDEPQTDVEKALADYIEKLEVNDVISSDKVGYADVVKAIQDEYTGENVTVSVKLTGSYNQPQQEGDTTVVTAEVTLTYTSGEDTASQTLTAEFTVVKTASASEG